MKNFFATLRFLLGHPLNRGAPSRALGRYLRWQVGARLVPGAVAVPFVAGTRLLVTRGLTGATGNIYCGLHEFEDMALVLHALRPGDLFVDVGANVGSYSILAAGAAGAAVLACEPVPKTFQQLEDNIRLNGLGERITPRRLALGANPGAVAFSVSLDTVNHVLTPAEVDSEPAIDVPMETLDRLLEGQSPVLLKLDVEGYETEVIGGASRVLRRPGLLAVLLELNGSGRRYGRDEAALHRTMLDAGFSPCVYEPFSRQFLAAGNAPGTAGNTLYVRDLPALAARVAAAPRFRVLDHDL